MDSFVYTPTAGGEEKRNFVAIDEYRESSGDGSPLVTASSAGDCPCSRGHARTRSVLCRPVCISGVVCCAVAVVACVVVVVVVVLLTHSSLREWEERMEARIERKIMSIVEEKCDFDMTEMRKVLSDRREKPTETALVRSRRSDNPKKGGNGGKGNKGGNKTPPPEQKPTFKPKRSKFVHLIGRNSTPINSESRGMSRHGHPSIADRSFLWDSQSPDIIQNMELVRDPYIMATVAVRIKKAGPYMVYSQVAVNGQSRLDDRFPYDCAHETVLTRGNGRDTVLLKSLTTQRYLGEPFPSGHSTDGLTPIDTKLQMGVFHLQVGDQLSVKFWEGCANFNYAMRPDHSYFGVIPMKL
ncbi:unnamed protein product [Lymnaea stagnalis]|uniref:THD domain-containing protein n=1 Tax=Lymnaea stagnalis TaxID=6523 RepID=A0AAV2H917_LYMST